MNVPFRHRREARQCHSCGSSYTGRGKFFCSRECAGNTKHGLSGTKEHATWLDMRNRCRNPDYWNYARYGGRGITVCDRWNDFQVFLEDMGPRPGPGYSIERKDNDGNYEPSNCKWGTKLEQSRNRAIAWTPEQDDKLRNGVRRGLPFKEIARIVGKPVGSIYARSSRLKLGAELGLAGTYRHHKPAVTSPNCRGDSNG